MATKQGAFDKFYDNYNREFISYPEIPHLDIDTIGPFDVDKNFFVIIILKIMQITGPDMVLGIGQEYTIISNVLVTLN